MEENKDKIQNVSNIKNKRIGSITFGISLIIFGITFFIESIFKFDIIRYIIMAWPIIFILLGVEILYYNTKADINIKYDIRGTIFLFIIISFGMLLGFISYGINEVLSNDEIRNSIINYYSI